MASFSGTVINSYVQTLVDVACKQGFPRTEILRPLEKEKAFLDHPGKRLSMNLMTRLWQHTAKITSDPDLGLHVGEAIRPGAFHILAPVVMNCRTLNETIEMMVSYQSLVSEGGTLKSQTTEQGIKLIYTPGTYSLPMTRFQIECIFTGIITFANWLLNHRLSLIEVCFTHLITHKPDEYQRLFNCPVYFSHAENSISISFDNLSLKIPHADPELRKHHQEIADRFLTNRQQKDQTIHELVELMKSRPDSGQISLTQAAGFLNLTPRTLQRRLQKADTSFQEIQNSIRMNQAHDLLLSTDLAVSDISEHLGYLNSSSFHRRFKSWYGIPPHEYRQSILGSPQ